MSYRSDVIDNVAESPYLKLAARLAMIFVTIIAAPYVYWVTSTLTTVTNTMGGIVIIQQQQQSQLTQMTQSLARLLDVSATESQARSTQDAIIGTQVEALRAESARINDHLNHLDDRINTLYQNGTKR